MVGDSVSRGSSPNSSRTASLSSSAGQSTPSELGGADLIHAARYIPACPDLSAAN